MLEYREVGGLNEVPPKKRNGRVGARKNSAFKVSGEKSRITKMSELEYSDFWLRKSVRNAPSEKPDGKTKLASLPCFKVEL